MGRQYNNKTIVLVLRSSADSRFTIEDVQLLCRNLREKASEKLTIICLWDKITEMCDLGWVVLIPMKYNWEHWWSKMNLFSPALEKYRPFLFMDLDTAVMGDVLEIFPTEIEEDQFIYLEDFYKPKKTASGVMWIPANSSDISNIWDKWMHYPDRWMGSYRGDQDFIHVMRDRNQDYFFQTFFPRKIVTFKPRGKGWLKEVPENSVLVCFHGNPKIPKAAREIDWVAAYAQEDPVMWVINLDHRSDRLAEFSNSKQFSKFHIHRFSGIKMDNGIDGCRESHYTLLKRERRYPLLILEDDAELIAGADWSIVRKAMSQLPKDWDILYLGGNLHQAVDRYSTNLYRASGVKTSHAIIYGSNRVVEFILKHGQGKPKDIFYMKEVQPRFNCFITNPMVVTQRGSYSDVRQGWRDHRKLMQDNFKKYAMV